MRRTVVPSTVAFLVVSRRALVGAWRQRATPAGSRRTQGAYGVAPPRWVLELFPAKDDHDDVLCVVVYHYHDGVVS